jgi:hypothetical protein
MTVFPLERAKRGIRTESLAGDHLRRLSDPSKIAKFPEPLPNPVNAVSASGGYKDAIGGRPAQLLVNLECNRFETLDAEWIRVTSARAEDGARIVLASLEKLPQQCFLITAANHPGSIRSHECELRGRCVRVAENDAVPACSGGIGCGCASVISGTDGRSRGKSKFDGHGNGHAIRTVFPRPRRIRSLILEQYV